MARDDDDLANTVLAVLMIPSALGCDRQNEYAHEFPCSAFFSQVTVIFQAESHGDKTLANLV
jgi:hypothetical protein